MFPQYHSEHIWVGPTIYKLKVIITRYSLLFIVAEQALVVKIAAVVAAVVVATAAVAAVVAAVVVAVAAAEVAAVVVVIIAAVVVAVAAAVAAVVAAVVVAVAVAAAEVEVASIRIKIYNFWLFIYHQQKQKHDSVFQKSQLFLHTTLNKTNHCVITVTDQLPTQCAAVTTNLLVMSVAPQKWK